MLADGAGEFRVVSGACREQQAQSYWHAGSRILQHWYCLTSGYCCHGQQLADTLSHGVCRWDTSHSIASVSTNSVRIILASYIVKLSNNENYFYLAMYAGLL